MRRYAAAGNPRRTPGRPKRAIYGWTRTNPLEVVAGCPVPIVIAGGKKIPELDALTMAYKAIEQGAAGVDMGRNVFLAEDPAAMAQAIRAVVHGNSKPQEAFDLYNTLKS